MELVEKEKNVSLFVQEEVRNIVKQILEKVIGPQGYENGKVNQWNAKIVELCLDKLRGLETGLRYIVQVVTTPKTGTQTVHTASSCFWDNTSDGSCTVRWENKSIFVIVSIFGLS